MVMNKKDRKAWLRILEAFIGILIVISAVLVIMSRQSPELDISENVYDRQRQILNIISKDDVLREEIIGGRDERVGNFIEARIPAEWEFAISICEVNEACSNSDVDYARDVYATEIIITSTLEEYNPKKLRFFVWMG